MAEDAEMRRIFDRVGFWAIAIRARRAALLERAAADSPTEGAVALADAHLQVEEWYGGAPNQFCDECRRLGICAYHRDYPHNMGSRKD
jgi:hypothetical protein